MALMQLISFVIPKVSVNPEISEIVGSGIRTPFEWKKGSERDKAKFARIDRFLQVI